MTAFYFQRLKAPQDYNGNPCRLVAAYDAISGDIFACYDEDYRGSPCWAREFNAVQLPDLRISKREFLEMRKMYCGGYADYNTVQELLESYKGSKR